MKQYKTNFDDFNVALEKSIKKRTNCNKEILVNMSSGYDTGTICCVLNKLNIKYNTATILGVENRDIIYKRNNINKNFISNFDLILTLGLNENHYLKNIILNQCENIVFSVCNKNKNSLSLNLDVFDDPARFMQNLY